MPLYPNFHLIPLNLVRCLVSFFGHQRSEQQLPADTTAMMSGHHVHPLYSPTHPSTHPAPPTDRPFFVNDIRGLEECAESSLSINS